MKLVNKEGDVIYRRTYEYYAGAKFGWLEYWPEILDDMRNGYYFEGFYGPLPKW